MANTNTKARAVTAKIKTKGDVNAVRDEAYKNLEKLLDSLIGKALFNGDAAVAITDDETVLVSAELRDATDASSANQAFKRAFPNAV